MSLDFIVLLYLSWPWSGPGGRPPSESSRAGSSLTTNEAGDRHPAFQTGRRPLLHLETLALSVHMVKRYRIWFRRPVSPERSHGFFLGLNQSPPSFSKEVERSKLVPTSRKLMTLKGDKVIILANSNSEPKIFCLIASTILPIVIRSR